MVGRNTSRGVAIAAALLALSVSCGGSDAVTTPVPPRVVTTIDVSPSARSLLIGDTLTLTATVRDQSGAAMSGVVVAWSTANAGVATVSGVGKVTAVAAGSVTISASAEGKTGTATLTITIPGPVATLEPSNAASASIGPAGGTLTTTSGAGIQYTLEIPAGALIKSEQIRMTPISAISRLGLSGGLAGAVELQPSGLIFALPARLRIRSALAGTAGTRLVGFSANSDFSQRELSFVSTASGEFVVPVSHFSATGAGFGTTFEVSQFPVMPSQSFESIFSRVVAIGPVPWDVAGMTLALQLAQQAFDQFILPPLRAAATDPALLDAISDYSRWRLMMAIIENNGLMPIALIGSAVDVLGVPPAFVDEALAGIEAAVDGIQLAVDANATLCGDQASITALRNVYYWQSWAAQFHADVAPNGLDDVNVLDKVRTKCAVVVLKNSNLPDSLPAGQNFNLDLNFALRFKNGVEQPTDFRVDLAGSGVAVTNPGGFTGIGGALSPVGYYTTVINPATHLGFRLKSSTCLVLSRTAPVPTTLCDNFELTKVLYFNDFAGTVGPEWNITTTATSPSGQRFLGELRSQLVILTVDSIPLHTRLQLEFDIYIMESWNGNGGVGSSAAPDVVAFEVQGGPVLKRTTFSNKERDVQAFPGDFPGSAFPAGSGKLPGSLGYPAGPDYVGDSSYRLRLTFDHTASVVGLIFGSQQSSGQNERWGIDNVVVRIVQP